MKLVVRKYKRIASIVVVILCVGIFYSDFTIISAYKSNTNGSNALAFDGATTTVLKVRNNTETFGEWLAFHNGTGFHHHADDDDDDDDESTKLLYVHVGKTGGELPVAPECGGSPAMPLGTTRRKPPRDGRINGLPKSYSDASLLSMKGF
jgi:hypothetical protein